VTLFFFERKFIEGGETLLEGNKGRGEKEEGPHSCATLLSARGRRRLALDLRRIFSSLDFSSETPVARVRKLQGGK
jgi:hypothetical protein